MQLDKWLKHLSQEIGVSSEEGELHRARLCHQNLKFWVWAALHNEHEYTVVSNERALVIMMAENGPFDVGVLSSLRNRQRLAEYNLLISLDSLAGALETARHFFPELRSIAPQAKRLMEEGKRLRELCERADARYKKLLPEDNPAVGRRRSGRASRDTNTHAIGERFDTKLLVADTTVIGNFTDGIPYPYPE